jgi:hypothetical protein
MATNHQKPPTSSTHRVPTTTTVRPARKARAPGLRSLMLMRPVCSTGKERRMKRYLRRRGPSGNARAAGTARYHALRWCRYRVRSAGR